MATFKSGAFIQQCFSAHPLCLQFKLLTLPDRVVVTCSTCNMRHRFFSQRITSAAGEADGPDRDAGEYLEHCALTHPDQLRVSAVNVMTDAVKLRCGECRRLYALQVLEFETYRKD